MDPVIYLTLQMRVQCIYGTHTSPSPNRARASIETLRTIILDMIFIPAFLANSDFIYISLTKLHYSQWPT